VKRSTLRCHVCGAEHPVQELVADIRREEAVRLYVCRRCAAQEVDAAEEEFTA
jgi:protein-arginine kinase activator protein McsA